MSQDQITQLLQQGIAAARSNRPDIARGIFQQVVTMDTRNETAWAWLASIARNNQERLIFLKKLWEINPQNEFALKGLRALGIDPEVGKQPSVQISVPLLDDTRFARAQQAVDEFLRRYTPEPVDHLGITWDRRTRARYGEAGAQRLRRIVYAAAALVFIVLVGGMIFLLGQVDLTGERQQVAFATRVPSQTPAPTLTPTLGGPTPTAFPESMAIAPTVIPAGLVAGDPYGLLTPTEIVPRPDVNVERTVERAANHYTIGDYRSAADILREERERSEPHCYPSVVYFEALSYAHLSEFARAESVLNWAQSYNPQRQYNSCQGSPLITAGFADVSFLQGDYTQALVLSEEALEADADLVTALLTNGRAHLALEQVTDAWQTVTRALEEYPRDANFLLLAAQIELANEQPNAALEYIGQVLYMDPDLLPALYLQAEAFLALGEQSPLNSDRREQAYGLAVRSAQTLLQYYEGDPTGYIYLAKARLGEGNADLAETALTRVLNVEDQLPDTAAPQVEEALRLRGELYFAQGRFDKALSDLETYANRSRVFDAQAVEMLVKSALELRDFATMRQWIAFLLNREPADPTYRLWQVRIWVDLCTFNSSELTCQYDDALDVLTDTFIASIPAAGLRADAYRYRGQARYHVTMQQSAVLSDTQRETAFQKALDDFTRALEVRESVLDHYYRGLLFEVLDEPVHAYEEYRWVDYWSVYYPYPFVDSAFRTRFARVARTVQDMTDDLIAQVDVPAPDVTPTGVEATPTRMAGATVTASPDPTEQPRATATSMPEPTRVPPADIP